MSSVKNQTGMAEKEVENGSGQKLSGTVREFLERHPKEPVFMMTPGGYVYLVPEQIGNLLAGQAVSGSPCSWRVCPDQGGGTSTAEGGFNEPCGRHLVCVNAVI